MRTVIFDREELRGMLRDFTVLTGIRISFWDPTGTKRVYSAEREDSAYCTWLQSVPLLHQACRACDRYLLDRAMQMRRACRIKCHADLEECATPVLVDGELLGFFMIGQTRVTGAAETRWAGHWYEQHGLDPLITKELYWQLPCISFEAQQAAERMLEALAFAACNRGFIRAARTGLAQAFEHYVEEHFAQPLTLDQLCDALGVSRSTLCHTLRAQLDTSFVDYLNAKRIKQAQALLTKGTPVAEVADKVGYTSPSYFSKVFKKHTGQPPSSHHRQVGTSAASQS